MRYVKFKSKEIEVLEYLHRKDTSNTARKYWRCVVLPHLKHKIKDKASVFNVSRKTIKRCYYSRSEIGVESLAVA